MAARKTVRVRALLDRVNRMNENSTVPPEARQALNYLVMDILLETGNYAGYGFLTSDRVPPGQLPGIRAGESVDEKFANTDDTRRVYYYSETMRADAPE